MITAAQFHTLFPNNKQPDVWAAALNAILPKYGIDTPLRIAAFLAQCGHESEGFTALHENLNYSAEALAATWPNRYAVDPKAKAKQPNELAKKLARNPEAIANNCYANRLGNGNEASGDGWAHRGRGAIQCTGRANYINFARSAGKPYAEIAAYLETPEGGVESACWYWKNNNLNVQADNGRNDIMTKLINGGFNGLADRNARYAAAKQIFVA
ncbi:MAG: glycoside hydrolase family 19 protein [Desulfuromonadaceae bacterium]|nr:glycoside hydrolase family 19 protein [Desulfuromonadaceae bacterium]